MERYKVVASTKNFVIEREATLSHLADASSLFDAWQSRHEAVRIINMETREIVETSY